MDEKKVLMVTFSRPDRPDITATLIRVPAEQQAEIVDISEASAANPKRFMSHHSDCKY